MFSRYTKYFFGSLVIMCALFSCVDNAGAQDQKKIDDQKLQEYFTKNHITPLKGPNGIYYTIQKEGSGPTVKAGLTVTIDYTGRLLDGTVFDSNTDPKFQHPEPLVFELGVGRVVAGWDKGIQLLKKGSVATLYLPSAMGYGSRANGPVPANAIMVFDVSVTDATK